MSAIVGISESGLTIKRSYVVALRNVATNTEELIRCDRSAKNSKKKADVGMFLVPFEIVLKELGGLNLFDQSKYDSVCVEFCCNFSNNYWSIMLLNTAYNP